MKNFLQQLKTRSHQLLSGAFVPLADYTGSKKLSGLFNNDQNLVTYLNTIFKMAITVGAILAVLRLLYAGYIYMASDVFTDKGKAKAVFADVFLGLFLLLSIYIILAQINPNLLNLDVKLEAITPAEVAPPSGAPAAVAGCATCVPIPAGVPVKVGACRGTCMVTPTMANELRALTIRAIQPSWYVSEAWPPTVGHASACHNNGACIDANINGGNVGSADITQFISAASGVGLNAQWEVGSQARKQALITAGVPATSILLPTSPPSVEHFHITGG